MVQPGQVYLVCSLFTFQQLHEVTLIGFLRPAISAIAYESQAQRDVPIDGDSIRSRGRSTITDINPLGNLGH